MKKEKTNIIPTGDRVLIREYSNKEKETITKSGIIIPITIDEDKGAKSGEIIAIGTGRYENSVLIPISLKKGDNVLFSWGDKIKVDDQEYFLVKESEVMAIISK